MIYMRGMKYEDLAAIADFLYYGEANIYQENLDNFLGIAEELKLKGLTGEISDTETASRVPWNDSNQMKAKYKNPIKDTSLMQMLSTSKLEYDISDMNSALGEFESEGAVALQNESLIIGIKELEEKVKFIMI